MVWPEAALNDLMVKVTRCIGINQQVAQVDSGRWAVRNLWLKHERAIYNNRNFFLLTHGQPVATNNIELLGNRDCGRSGTLSN